MITWTSGPPSPAPVGGTSRWWGPVRPPTPAAPSSAAATTCTRSTPARSPPSPTPTTSPATPSRRCAGCRCPSRALLAQQLLRLGGDVLRREPQLLEDRARRRARPVAFQPDAHPAVAHPPRPAEGAAGLDRHVRGDRRRQDRVPVGLILAGEDFPAGQGHHAGPDALLGQLVLGSHGHRQLRTGADQDDLGRAAGRIRQYVAALLH